MLKQFFLKKRTLLILSVLLYFTTYSVGIDTYPAVAMDEPWLSFFALDVWGNYPHDGLHSGTHQLFQVYPFFLSLWQNTFGITLGSIRAFAVLIGFLSGVVFNQVLRQLSVRLPIRLLILFLFFISNISFITFRWGRPEAMVTLLSLIMIYVIQKGIKTHKKSHFFIAGLISGLLFLTHPVSAVLLPPTLLVFYLLTPKALRNFTLFSTGFLCLFCIGLLYLLITSPHYLIHELIPHTLGRFALSGESVSFTTRLTTFIASYSLGIKRGYILLFEAGILFFCITKFKQNRLFSTYAIWGSLALFLGILLIDPFRRRYFGIILIFSLITLALTLQNRKEKITLPIMITLFLYAANSLLGNAYLIATQYKNTPYSILTQMVQTHIPNGATVVAPIELWLTVPQNKTISTIHHFPILGTNTYKDLKNSQKVDYLIYTKRIAAEELSPTTGKVSTQKQTTFTPFHNFCRSLIPPNQLLTEIDTIPYGKIQIYKLK